MTTSLAPVWLKETKTTTEDLSNESVYWRRLTLDLQVSIYTLGAKALGYNVVGCLFDALRVPQLQPKLATPVELRKYTKKTGKLYATQREQDETPDEFMRRCLDEITRDPDRYYRRGEIVRLENEDREAAMDVWQTTIAMRESRRLSMYPRHAGACMQWSRACEYLSVCCGEASKDDPVLFEKVSTEHEELELSESKRTRVTQSSLKTYRSCPRKYQLRNVLGVRSRSRSETLRRGHSVHGAIEVLCKLSDLDLAIASLDQRDPYKFAKERAMLVGYVAMWGMPFGVIAVEKQFELPLINPETGGASKTFSIAGKFDALVTADPKHMEAQLLAHQLEDSVNNLKGETHGEEQQEGG